MKRKCFYPVTLIILGLVLIILTWKPGYLYGSEIDWYSQHIGLAETIRSACLAQKTIAPAFLPLGGGCNGYQFAYYGYFRPDILLGCLLPQIPMEILLPAYMIAGYLLSGVLCYFWLKHDMEPFFAFIGAALFLSAACFFHLHRQVMFVSYMPFLMLAFLSIRRRHTRLLPVWILLIALHSFYYAPASLLVLGWYWYQQEQKAFFRPWLRMSLTGTCMAAMLLLPAGLAILEHRHAEGGISPLKILLPNLTLNGFLYDYYGIGLTAICFYALLLGLTHKTFRKNSIILLVCGIWCLVPYLLNGTLYVRPKILMVLLPLFILHTAQILFVLYQKQIAWKIPPCIVLILCCIPFLRSKRLLPFVLLDILIVICFAALGTRKKILHRPAYLVLLVMPFILFICNAKREDFPFPRTNTNRSFAAQQPQITDKQYRFETLSVPLDHSNRLFADGQQKSSMYSSVTNQGYNTLYYDLLQTPIRINNRTAILMENNPFMLRLMGIRYLTTTSNALPAGYRILTQQDKYILAENPNALPIAYTTNQCMGLKQFESISENNKLEALTRYTIVPDMKPIAFTSEITPYSPILTAKSLPDTLQITRSGNGYDIDARKTTTVEYQLDKPIQDKILLLSFTVENKTRQAVRIDINHICNHLSNASAPYPNGNNHFHYQISDSDEISSLKVTFSKGHYHIGDINWREVPVSMLTEQTFSPAALLPTQGNEILSCQVTAQAGDYFVTSIPMQRGLSLTIDGKKIPLERVNTAFAGAKLTAGKHTLRLSFTPPGQNIGYGISLLSFLYFCITIWKEEKKNAHQK